MLATKAQDVIYLKNGEKIMAQNISVDENWIITYKTWGEPDGTTHTVNGKEEALKIVYVNGSVYKFNKRTKGLAEANKKPPAFLLVGVGPAFALGSFGSTTDDDAEFATSGFAVKLDIGGTIGEKKRVGVIGTVAVVRSYGDESVFCPCHGKP
jgi:hypothetical protein